MARELIRFIECKKRNRRVVIHWYKCDGEDMFYLHTRRLVDFKQRKIFVWGGWIGFDTFMLLRDIIQLMTDDLEFKKQTDDSRMALLRDKYAAITNCNMYKTN